MLLEPSLDKLLEKIDSKYSLVILAAKRAQEIDAAGEDEEEKILDNYKSVRNVGKALEEIEAGDLIIDSSKLK